MKTTEILTKADLDAFEQRIIASITDLISEKTSEQKKEWLTTKEVSQEFGIKSTNTLKKHLKPQKLGGRNYYNYSEIIALLSK